MQLHTIVRIVVYYILYMFMYCICPSRHNCALYIIILIAFHARDATAAAAEINRTYYYNELFILRVLEARARRTHHDA